MRLGLLKPRARNRVMEAGSGTLNASVNVTPLVDVCLVLLIIFLVVTPMLQSGISVHLPGTLHPEEMPDKAKQLVLAMRADRSLWLGSQQFSSTEQFAQALAVRARGDQSLDVLVKADQHLDYGEVLDLLKIAREAGFSNVGLIAEKIQSEAP